MRGERATEIRPHLWKTSIKVVWNSWVFLGEDAHIDFISWKQKINKNKIWNTQLTSHGATEFSLATLWYHQELTTNSTATLIWHVSWVFCKYFGYFPPPALDYIAAACQCRCCDKYSKAPFLTGQVENIFRAWRGRMNCTFIDKSWMD